MKECSSCGSPIEGNPLSSKWKCEYCKTVNYNEDYVRLYAKQIDFSKAHNLLQVGIAAYEGREYAKARDAFEKVLIEDSNSCDAWIYGALAIAQLADLSNIEKSISGVESYLKKAREIDDKTEILAVGESIVRNTIGRILLRAIRRHQELARKKYFAFESVNKSKAEQGRNEELQHLFHYADYVFDNPPDDSSIIGPIAIEVLLASREGKCSEQIINSAKSTLRNINKNNQQYYQSLLEYVNKTNPRLYNSILSDLKTKEETTSQHSISISGNSQSFIAGLSAKHVIIIIASMVVLGMIGYNIGKSNQTSDGPKQKYTTAETVKNRNQDVRPATIPTTARNVNESEIDTTINNFYKAVQDKRVGDAIDMFSAEKKPKIKVGLIEGVAKDTEYYSIDSINIINNDGNHAQTAVRLRHKKYKRSEENWEIYISLVRESGEWKIVSTPGKKL